MVAKKYTKKPVTIEAVVWTGDNEQEICEFMAHKGYQFSNDGDDYQFHIWTLEGSHLATVGDFIIKGVKGEFYPCKPDIFALTYDAA